MSADEWSYREWQMSSSEPLLAPWTSTDENQALRCLKGGWQVKVRTVVCTPSPWQPMEAPTTTAGLVTPTPRPAGTKP